MSNYMSASMAFFRAYNGNINTMTPHVCGYRTFKVEDCRYFGEISRGEGLYGEGPYGVTIIRIEGEGEEPIKMPAYSDCFDTKQEAQDHWLNFKNDRLKGENDEA